MGDMMRAEGKEKPAGFDDTDQRCAGFIQVQGCRHRGAHHLRHHLPYCVKVQATLPHSSVTSYGQVARQMQIFRGCIPLLYEKEREAAWMKDVDDRVQYAIDFGKRSNFIAPGDNVVVITGWKKGSGSSNTVRILPVS